jgi:putative iron-dependent peroxidase
MARPQSAICAECGDFGLFLTVTLVRNGAGNGAAVRCALAAIPNLTRSLAARLGQPGLVSAVGIGADAWGKLMTVPRPSGLEPFKALGEGARQAPATPADLFIHIHSPSHDANFELARAVSALLGDQVRVVEEVVGFKRLGARDLTGFVDGTENPASDERVGVALVGDEEPAFAGGSYVSIQRYVHDMSRWEAQPIADQEAAIGRTKEGDEELDDDAKPPSAHIARVVIEEDGAELEILRQSMPYGTTSESGLYFVAYCRSAAPFRKMLERMVLSDGDGHHDRLLDFTRAVTGAAFFAPSEDLLLG